MSTVSLKTRSNLSHFMIIVSNLTYLNESNYQFKESQLRGKGQGPKLKPENIVSVNRHL